ncbi:MAG: NUDIX hydrolase [Cyanobacteria bacterium P01_H01_bin.74]
MVHQYQHKVRVGVVIIDEAGVLLVQQNNKPFWVFPGGTLEPGEGLFDCGIREIDEELTLSIEIKKILYLADFVIDSTSLQSEAQKQASQKPIKEERLDTAAQEIKHTVDIFLHGSLIKNVKSSSVILSQDENLNAFGWFSLEKLKKLPVKPAIVQRKLIADWEISPSLSQSECLYLGIYGPD